MNKSLLVLLFSSMAVLPAISSQRGSFAHEVSQSVAPLSLSQSLQKDNAEAFSNRDNRISSFLETSLPTDINSNFRLPERNANRPATREAPMTEIIWNPPGEVTYYSKYAWGIYLFWGQLPVPYSKYDFYGKWFWDGDDVYMYNPLSMAQAGSYIKGHREGNVITVPVDQTIIYYASDGYGLNIGVLRLQQTPGVDDEGNDVVYNDYIYDSSVDSFSYIYNETQQRWELSLPSGRPAVGDDPQEYVIGYYYTDDYSWNGYCDFVQYYSALEESLIPMPENSVAYTLVNNSSYEAHHVNVATTDEYVYMQGLDMNMPTGVLRLKREGNKAYIVPDQMVGVYQETGWVFTRIGTYDSNSQSYSPYNGDEQLYFQYDPEANTWKADFGDLYLVFSANRNGYLDVVSAYNKFDLFYAASYWGIPSDPFNLQYTDWNYDAYGWNQFVFSLSNISTDKTLLQSDKLFYSVFVDGEPLVFEEEEMIDPITGRSFYRYRGVEGPTEYINYDFYNLWDCDHYSYFFQVGIYENGVSTLGLQAVYMYGDEWTYSRKLTMDISEGGYIKQNAENTTYEEPVNPENPNAGVSSVLLEPVKVEYYDLNGLKLTSPGKGIYIKRSYYPDGTVKTRKFVGR